MAVFMEKELQHMGIEPRNSLMNCSELPVYAGYKEH